MLKRIIEFSVRNRLIIFLSVALLIGIGIYSLQHISVGAVPDVTNNQVQVLTTSRNLSTLDVEQFITTPVELEMANLQGVQEIRSISKFGLSVVTIVFDEKMGTYLPRQLIAEKIKSASEQIPEEYGSPEMGPITTGLGEIYQYILDVKPEYQQKYTPKDLRTIQDWIVKRQLSGIPGVVEVNTWGGYLNQYEVAIETEKLKAMNITIQEVFDALERNNSISGGGYIEKNNQAYFIRGEGMVNSLNDIEKTVVKVVNAKPILIQDVAQVQFGHAPRFGAITGNGEGEKVLGQVMMLKGASSKEVIDAVKERVEQINKTLPEGVYINGFLDRSDLIGRTTSTVEENLIFGFLIVVFVVVLLLGNLRSGLIVASVIPLSLLFGLTLMNVFKVDANLMSLGAIDFGIIIDGAVIIVEYIAYQMTKNKESLLGLSKIERQEQKNIITEKSAFKMMNSAVFGQFIILIVFIPILSLTGVEGKMFKPMALAFSFALIGAMILCLTYVPAIASVVLKPSKRKKKNISELFIEMLQNIYRPILQVALRLKLLVVLGALALLASAVILFRTMGAEFVPTLDEGDFVIQPVLKTGTSLSQTIDITTKIESILLEKFPEVEQVVSRIGAAEVPTDPMSMEESDVIIKLKPKKEWETASSKEELADKFKEALLVIPGIDIEFTQPIEMRFNELITGVRSDIAIKIQGEDLDLLYDKATEIQSKIENVEGAADITVEKVVGLPQMTVKFNRDKIARYGLNIDDINNIISMGFAGKAVSQVFEQEKRFDLVVRFAQNDRNSIQDLKNILIDTPIGEKIPLSEVASIAYTKGPAKISRDNTRRRVVVGINVRNRDLQSVVTDIQQIVDAQVDIPTGYSLTYGGQFENLNSAKQRLLVAVPIALLLIFVMLYFAFNSVKEAILVFTAIPLAAVGGVFLLWLRGLPFSISAGVGFIALFGIAVLNGIVLIENFNELKEKGMNLHDRIIHGAVERLRPVLLTAMAAALGFLPMAISTNAGAEVQRPLATVVIGGLLTSTLLTLVVLPVLYSVFEQRAEQKALKTAVILLFFIGLGNLSFAQEMNFEQLVIEAQNNHPSSKIADLKYKQAHIMSENPLEENPTNFYVGRDQNNLTIDNKTLTVVGVEQEFRLPGVAKAQREYYLAQADLLKNEANLSLFEQEVELKKLYSTYQIVKAKQQLYEKMNALYSQYYHNANRKFELGATNYLEAISAKAKQKQVLLELQKIEKEELVVLSKIKKAGFFSKLPQVKVEEPKVLPIENAQVNPSLAHLDMQNKVSQSSINAIKKEALPNFVADYSAGLSDSDEGVLHAFQVGVAIPLAKKGIKAKLQAEQMNIEIAEHQKNITQQKISAVEQQQLAIIEQQQLSIDYYLNEGNELADEIIRTANLGYKNGEIDFFDYIKSIDTAHQILLQYYDELDVYNQAVIAKNYVLLNY